MLPIITEVQKQLELCQAAIRAKNVADIKKHADYLQRLLKDALAVPYVAAVLRDSVATNLTKVITEAEGLTLAEEDGEREEKLAKITASTAAALTALTTTSEKHFTTAEIVKKADGKYVRSEAVQYLAGGYSTSGEGYKQFYSDFNRTTDVLIYAVNGSKQSLKLMHTQIKLQLLREYFNSKLGKTRITTEQNTFRAIISSIDAEKQRVEELAKIIADQHFPDSLAYKLISQYIERQFTPFCRHLTTAERIDADGAADTAFKKACAYQLERKLLTDYFNGNRGQLLLMLSASNQWNHGATTEVMSFSGESIPMSSYEDSLYYVWKCDPGASAWTIDSQNVVYQKRITANPEQLFQTAMCAKRSITVTQGQDRLVIAASHIAFTTPSTTLEVVDAAAPAADVDPITITPEWFQMMHKQLLKDPASLFKIADAKELDKLAATNSEIKKAVELYKAYKEKRNRPTTSELFKNLIETDTNNHAWNTIVETLKLAVIAHYQEQKSTGFDERGELARKLELKTAEVARAKKLAEVEILMATVEDKLTFGTSEYTDIDIRAATAISILHGEDTAILAKTYAGNEPFQRNLQAKIEELITLRDEVAKAAALRVLDNPTAPIKPTKPAKSNIAQSKSHRKLFVKIRNAIKIIAVLAAIAAAALILTGIVVLPPVLPFVCLVIAAGLVTGIGAWAACTAVMKAITYAVDKYTDYQNNKSYKQVKVQYDHDMIPYNARKVIDDGIVKDNIDIITTYSPPIDTTDPLADGLHSAIIAADTKEDFALAQREARATIDKEEETAFDNIITTLSKSPVLSPWTMKCITYLKQKQAADNDQQSPVPSRPTAIP